MTDYLKNLPTETVSHGEVSVTFPESLKTPSTREWLGPSLEALAESLHQNRYENSKLPRAIREGQEHLRDPNRLTQALTPPAKFTAENLTEATTKHIAQFAREKLGTGSPLKFAIDLGSFNLMDTQLDSHNTPPLLDALFLQQVRDYLTTLDGYEPGLDLTFDLDITGDQWVYEPLLGKSKLANHQKTTHDHLINLINIYFPEQHFLG